MKYFCKLFHNIFYKFNWFDVETGSGRGHDYCNYKCKICKQYID